MRLLAIAVLGALLVVVYWFGIHVYSENIEQDITARTQHEIENHSTEISGISHIVDGRDVTLLGTSASTVARSRAADSTADVWGVRVLENLITVEEPASYQEELPVTEPAIDDSFNLHAEHVFPNLWMNGRVDDSAYETLVNIHRALPPESLVDYSELDKDAANLTRSPRVVETGIAAVTQLNPGRLTITSTQFILEGTVYSHDRKRTVEQLIDVRRHELEPLEIIVNITVESPGITQACSDGIQDVLANNAVNYAVNHFAILDEHSSVLGPMVDTLLGVCAGQVSSVLVEGHADYTGGAKYNQGLSERRSGTIRNHLIERGVDAQLINAFGYGEFRPIASNDTTDGRAMNRRTEIYLLIHEQMSGDSVPSITLIEE